jgi:hypothetical protein
MGEFSSYLGHEGGTQTNNHKGLAIKKRAEKKGE